MKFRDGMWLTAEGLSVSYAEQVYDIKKTPRGLRLLCPTKKIRSRGDTLNLSTLTLVSSSSFFFFFFLGPQAALTGRACPLQDIEAQSDGIISVETTHWAGDLRRGPNFDLYPAGKPDVEPIVTEDSSRGTTLTAGALSATIKPGDDFEISFDAAASGSSPARHLTSLASRSIGLAYSPAVSNPLQTGDMRNFEHHLFTQTSLGVGESVHGLGERFGPFNKLGQSVTLWNADGGTSSDQAYKNISFWLSNRGYGVFIDHAGKVELEIGSERCARVQTSVAQDQRLKWYLLYGPSPKEVLYRYAVLTGQPSAVPSWSFGLWLSTSFTTDYDEATVRSFLEGMRQRNIAVDVFHYDCFWMPAFQWTDFVFDAARFPDPKGQIARLKADGLVKKVCVWINPYIAQHGAAFAEAAANGYLLKRPNGSVWQWDLWQAGMGLVDFTNPAAVTWYKACLNKLFDQGVDALKTDFGERIPTRDVAWFDSSVDPAKMHNYYAFLYNRVVYEALEARYGRGQAVLFARAACAGTQRFPLQWGGDCESTPAAMAESIRGGLGLGLGGFAFWSVDIGGFEGRPPAWIYKRWVALGLLCSHSRLHGSSSYRVPWLIDDDDGSDQGCSRTLAAWTALKNRLMPYLAAQARVAVQSGLPLSMRAVCLEFPDDPTAWYLDRQFMVGDRLLVAPVFDEDGHVEFYLPAGTWTSFFNPAQVREGPGWFRETHGFGTLPLYVRAKTVLLLGHQAIRGAVWDYAADLEIRLYQVSESAEAALVDCEGKHLGTVQVSAEGKVLKGEDLLKGKYTVIKNGQSID